MARKKMGKSTDRLTKTLMDQGSGALGILGGLGAICMHRQIPPKQEHIDQFCKFMQQAGDANYGNRRRDIPPTFDEARQLLIVQLLALIYLLEEPRAEE